MHRGDGLGTFAGHGTVTAGDLTLLLGGDGDGPVRTKAKKAGVIDPSSGKKKLDFDPKDLSGTSSKAEDKLTKDAEDVIGGRRISRRASSVKAPAEHEDPPRLQ